jgi:hypothetical protein
MAETDGYIGYMKPYANSHVHLDEDTAFQREVVNVAHALAAAVDLARTGSLENPGRGLPDLTPSERTYGGPAPPDDPVDLAVGEARIVGGKLHINGSQLHRLAGTAERRMAAELLKLLYGCAAGDQHDRLVKAL